MTPYEQMKVVLSLLLRRLHKTVSEVKWVHRNLEVKRNGNHYYFRVLANFNLRENPLQLKDIIKNFRGLSYNQFNVRVIDE